MEELTVNQGQKEPKGGKGGQGGAKGGKGGIVFICFSE